MTSSGPPPAQQRLLNSCHAQSPLPQHPCHSTCGTPRTQLPDKGKLVVSLTPTNHSWQLAEAVISAQQVQWQQQEQSRQGLCKLNAEGCHLVLACMLDQAIGHSIMTHLPLKTLPKLPAPMKEPEGHSRCMRMSQAAQETPGPHTHILSILACKDRHPCFAGLPTDTSTCVVACVQCATCTRATASCLPQSADSSQALQDTGLCQLMHVLRWSQDHLPSSMSSKATTPMDGAVWLSIRSQPNVPPSGDPKLRPKGLHTHTHKEALLC